MMKSLILLLFVITSASAQERLAPTRTLVSGPRHTCIHDSAQGLYCWGENQFGQLGFDSHQKDILSPTPILSLPGPATQLSLGNAHSCAVVQEQAYCWGANDYGQLGDNTTTSRALPRPVLSEDGQGLLTGVTAIAAGNVHTCALLKTGEVRCWGRNNLGQLGNHTNVQSLLPTSPEGLPAQALSLTSGDHHVCALSFTRVYCWGDNNSGQLGIGTQEKSLTPVEVKDEGGQYGINGITDVQAGAQHTCASRPGELLCWGNNSSGQLGDPTYKSLLSSLPIRARGLPAGATVSRFSGNLLHQCAQIDQDLYCWGDNSYGQLGRTPIGPGATTPEKVVGLVSAPVQITTGETHTCAVTDDLSVYCWGDNSHGQLGIGSTTASAQPQRVVF